METLIQAGLLNALFAALLAVIVAGLAILCRGRPAVVHARANREACRHTIVEQVNTAFRRIGLIFPLEAEGDNPDWATIWLTGVGMPAAA